MVGMEDKYQLTEPRLIMQVAVVDMVFMVAVLVD